MDDSQTEYDAAIIGAGPAGLSAALTLARTGRRVVVCDHGRPRNAAARAVHCYLGREGVSPAELRAQGRREAQRYGATFLDGEVVAAKCLTPDDDDQTRFHLQVGEESIAARTVILATGVIDTLPDIPGLAECYGVSVHHCPYCDGWEHRDQRLIAFGNAAAAVDLALLLRDWTTSVAACTGGAPTTADQQRRLAANSISLREERIDRLERRDQQLTAVCFADGGRLSCDALFFSSTQFQRSKLPQVLGCRCDEDGLIETKHKQRTNVPGLFLAGDADGDSQFAIVAAAEGAVAATAAHQLLVEQDRRKR